MKGHFYTQYRGRIHIIKYFTIDDFKFTVQLWSCYIKMPKPSMFSKYGI